jgi:hypothetical protein
MTMEVLEQPETKIKLCNFRVNPKNIQLFFGFSPVEAC